MWLRIFPRIIAIEGSLLHWQQPATCPYPEPDWSNPTPSNSTSSRHILILSPLLSPVLPIGLFPSHFPNHIPAPARTKPPANHRRAFPRSLLFTGLSLPPPTEIRWPPAAAPSAAVRLLGLRVRIPLAVWMSVCCECCVLSGRDVCVGLITRPEESYRVWPWSLDNQKVVAHCGLFRRKCAEMCRNVQKCIFGNTKWLQPQQTAVTATVCRSYLRLC